jgi:hypothetical protein
MRNAMAMALAVGAALVVRTASATDIEEASACGIDPAKSRFETTHYRGGDVTVVVAVDEGGQARAALDPGPPASMVAATGRTGSSIFPASEPGRLAAMSAPERVLILCEPGRRKVVVTEPLASARALPGLEPLPAHSGWFCDEEAPKYFANPQYAGADRFAASLEYAPIATGWERRVSWMAVSPERKAENPGTAACSLTRDLVLCRDASRCAPAPLSPPAAPVR